MIASAQTWKKLTNRTVRVYQVDVFTDRLLQGNPAGMVFQSALPVGDASGPSKPDKTLKRQQVPKPIPLRPEKPSPSGRSPESAWAQWTQLQWTEFAVRFR